MSHLKTKIQKIILEEIKLKLSSEPIFKRNVLSFLSKLPKEFTTKSFSKERRDEYLYWQTIFHMSFFSVFFKS